MQELPDDIRGYIEARIAERAPQRLLVVAPDSLSFDTNSQREAANAGVVTRITPGEAAATLGALAGFDLAVVLDPAREIDAQATTRMLARLRNAGASAVIAATPCPRLQRESGRGTRFGRGEFLALGFRRARDTARMQSGWMLYRYDIHDYKITPNWLNSRYWANPGRWDKDRW